MLDGRVKTLHPKVHGGILARRDLPEHMAALEEHDIPTIDLLVVNLYPFEQTVAKDECSLEDAIENIDIGGPTMLRSAAKNHRDVTVVVDPADYAAVLDEMRANGKHASATTTNFRLATKVFAHTAQYDGAITNYLTSLARRAAARDAQRLSGDAQPGVRQGAGPALRRKPASERRVLPRSEPCRPARWRTTSNCRARNCRTTTSPMPMRRGNA